MKILKSAFSLVMIELSFVLFFVLFWASNKGFEFSDEAFYVLSVTQAPESTDTFYYQHIIKFFFGWLNPGYVGLRLLRLVFTLFASFILAFSISKALIYRETVSAYKKRLSVLVLISICFVAIASSYAIYPQAISYNNLTEIGLAVLVGLLFMYSLQVVRHKDRLAFRYAFFIGVVVLLIFYCRFTTGLLLFLAIPIMMFLLRLRMPNSNKFLLKDGLYFLGGLIANFLTSSLLIYSGIEWLAKMIEGLKYIPGHSISDILTTYSESFMYVRSSLTDVQLILPLVLLLLVNFKNKLDVYSFYGITLYQLFSAVFLLFLSHYIFDNELIYSGISHYSTAIFFHLMVLLCVVVLLLSNRVIRQAGSSFWKNKHLVILALFLLFLPLIGSIGTDNKLHVQFLQFVFAWIILALAVLYKIRHFIGPILSGGLVTILIVGTFTQTIYGLVYSPYRIPGTLLDQKIVKELKPGDRLLVDPKTNAAINEFSFKTQELKNFQQGDPMIVLMSVPGYIYLANGGVVKNAWANSLFPETVCFSINSSMRNDLSKAVIMLPRSRPLSPMILDCMHNRDINFPENYLLRESLVDPVYGMQMDLYSRSSN